MLSSIATSSCRVSARVPARCPVLRATPPQQEDAPQTSSPTTEQPAPAGPSQSAPKDVTAVQLDVPKEPVDFKLFGGLQELINGRSAMLGFAVAVVSEKLSQQSVWSQIAGKYVNGKLVEQPHGMASLYFAAIVTTLFLASFAPVIFKNQSPEDREFGPFKAGLEITLGRIAMVGFTGLLIVEWATQNPIF